MNHPSNLSRRRFNASLSLAGSAVCLESLRGTAEGADESTGEPEAETPLQAGMRSWVDTLYPEDDLSPGAGALGVHLGILDRAAKFPKYQSLIEKGLEWADSQARVSGADTFAQLEEGGRIAVVTAAEAAEPKSLPRVFFLQTLREGASFYYGQSESWTGMGFAHPPQPLGFLDFAEPPTPTA